jgi:hypothetical protein
VVDIVAPGQSDQDVDIQQVRFHGSSSAASVCSSVIGGASSGIESCGKGVRCSHGLRRKAARDAHASSCCGPAERVCPGVPGVREAKDRLEVVAAIPKSVGHRHQPNPKTGNQSRISAPQRLFASLLDRRKPNEIMSKGVNKDTGARNATLMSRRE